ncbi:hypothetical protein GCM10023235_01710 [Kitasatospora terrestris]|uniref:Uncharacterized protein n=1 Tax=Kitasatospora terrestris TaxID=258051 RepID=A0ABP9D6F1_9ACTN
MVDPALKAALTRLRTVKSQRPTGMNANEFADWRERIADSLDGLARVLLFEEDQVGARAEAAAARAQADEIRRLGLRAAGDRGLQRLAAARAANAALRL